MPNPLSYLIDPIKNIMKPLYDTGVSLFGADSIRTPNSFNLNDFDISSYTDWQNNLSSSFGDAYSSVAMPNNNIQSILTQLGNVKDKNWESALTQAQQDLMNGGNTKSGWEAFDKSVADIHKQQSNFRTGFGKDLMAANSAYSLMGLQQGEAAYNQTQLLDPLSKNNINAFTDAADTGFMANGGMVAKRTLTKADGGIAGGEFIQSEKGEVVMLPDGTIVKTGATKTHKKMKSEGDSDKITDALPEGSIVFPSDKKFTLKKKDFEGIAINVTTPEYKEGEKPQDPEITYFTDLFTKDKNTPAELILQLSKMIPVTQRGEGLINGDDPITNNTNAKNLQARMPWVEQVLSTFPKGQEILGGQNEGATEGTTDGAIEGEETEQFAEGGMVNDKDPKKTTIIVAVEAPQKAKFPIDKPLPKNAPAELKTLYDTYQTKLSNYQNLKKQYDNTSDIETKRSILQQVNGAEEDIRSTAFKYQTHKLNKSGVVKNDEFIKEAKKFKSVANKYAPNTEVIEVPFYGDLSAVESAIKGVKGNKELAVFYHQDQNAGGINTKDIYNKAAELGVNKIYGGSCNGEKQTDCLKNSNFTGDFYYRAGDSWHGVADNPNVVVKDKSGKVDEDATIKNILYSNVSDDNGNAVYRQGGTYEKLTKNNALKLNDGGMITEYKEGGIVGYEPKKALVGTLIAGAIGLGASAFNAYYTNQQLNKMQREAEKLKNKEMQAAGVMAGVQGASLLAQDTKVDTARDNPLYQLQESYLNQMPTEIPQWQVQNYYQELDKTARQNEEWYNNITDPYTRAALMDDSKTLEAKNKAMMQVADTNLKLQQGALDAKYKHYGATLADEVAAANQMRGNTNAVMQGLGQTMVDYEQNKLAAERGLTNAKTQVLSGKASNISNITNNVANLGMAAGSSIDAAKMQTDQMNLMRDLYGNKNTTTGFTPDPNIGKSFSGVTNMELPPVKFTPQLNSTQPSFMTNETQLDALTAIFGDRRMAEIMLDIYKKSNKKETNPENIYNSYMENN